jgi:flagellar assembly protein FliH
MDLNSLSSGEVTSLIDRLLKEKDPATVGLRRILKTKAAEGEAFPVKPFNFRELEVPGAARHLFSEEETRVISLEKQLVDLRGQVNLLEKQAKVQTEEAFVQGMNKGVAQGRDEGYKKASTEFKSALSQLQTQVAAICKRIEMGQKSIFSNAVHMLVRLSCELAKKIISTEVSINPAIISNVLKKALSYVGEREKIIIRVAPPDLKTVEESREFWMPVMERLSAVAIEVDERVERGGCIVESNSGAADARLGVQFDELATLLEKIWAATAFPTDGDEVGAAKV